MLHVSSWCLQLATETTTFQIVVSKNDIGRPKKQDGAKGKPHIRRDARGGREYFHVCQRVKVGEKWTTRSRYYGGTRPPARLLAMLSVENPTTAEETHAAAWFSQHGGRRVTFALRIKRRGDCVSLKRAGREVKTHAPRQLIQAMNALAGHACALCELPPDYAKGCEVVGVSFSDARGIMGAVITVKKPIETSNLPFVFTAPHKTEHPAGGSLDYSKCLPGKCAQALKRLQAIASELFRQGRGGEPTPGGGLAS